MKSVLQTLQFQALSEFKILTDGVGHKGEGPPQFAPMHTLHIINCVKYTFRIFFWNRVGIKP